MSDNPYKDLIENPQSRPAPAAAPSVSREVATGNVYETLIAQEPMRAPQPKPKPQAELRSAEYSPRERIGNWMQDALIGLGAQPYVAGRVGRGALDAASLIPPVGGSIAAADAGYYATKGDPIMFGINALGALPAATTARRAYQGMPQRTMAPEVEQLREAKQQAYKAWRDMPITYSPAMMDDAVNHVTQKLIQEGADPAIKQTAFNIGLGLKKQTGMTNNDFELMHRHLRGGKDATERYAGWVAADALEDYMLNPPAQHIRSGTQQQIAEAREYLQAGRSNAAAEFRNKVISGKINAAEITAELGGEFTDTFRRRMGGLSSTQAGEKAMRGFTQAERDRVRDEVTGSLLERTTGSFGRGLDNYSTKAGLGLGATAGAAPWMTGGAIGLDPLTAGAAGLGIAAGGKIAGKALQERSTNLAKQSADELGASIRMRSQLAQAPGSPYGQITDPIAQASDARKYLMYPWLRQEGEEAVEQDRVPYELRK